jgi:hypothetical protein
LIEELDKNFFKENIYYLFNLKQLHFLDILMNGNLNDALLLAKNELGKKKI